MKAYLPGGKRRCATETLAPPKWEARPEHLLFGREEAKEIVLSYLRGCRDKTDNCFDARKYSMLGASGVKGIGKSEILWQICERWAKEALGEKTKTLYVTYNGGGMAGEYCKDYEQFPLEIVDSVGHLLLVSCGVEEEAAQKYKFDHAIDCIRSGLGCGEKDTLVVCVDEIIELDVWNPQVNRNQPDTMAQMIMSRCMVKQDKSNGKLIFIFTGILDSMFHELTALSGRKIIPLPLSMIPLRDVFDHLVEQKLKALARNQPAVYQLILSCAGHPRATVKGLPIASHDWGETEDVATAALIKARSQVISQCKFHLEYLDDNIVAEWFGAEEISPELRRDLLEKGILHSFTDEIEFLFPLLLQRWAEAKQSKSSFAFHLNGLFDADQVLGTDTEKFMEAVMYHYEAVLRLALKGRPVRLEDFYKSKHIDGRLQAKLVTARLPEGTGTKKVVRYVEDFSDMDFVIELLKDGYLVVSEAHSEKGIEYLAPFEIKNGDLLVACVQCKFVYHTTDWAKIRSAMDDAVAGFKTNNIKYFPVVYATPNQASIRPDTYKSGVYFTETDLFTFTKRVGLLRLHTQKLGHVLGEMYPILQGAGAFALEEDD